MIVEACAGCRFRNLTPESASLLPARLRRSRTCAVIFIANCIRTNGPDQSYPCVATEAQKNRFSTEELMQKQDADVAEFGIIYCRRGNGYVIMAHKPDPPAEPDHLPNRKGDTG